MPLTALATRRVLTIVATASFVPVAASAQATGTAASSSSAIRHIASQDVTFIVKSDGSVVGWGDGTNPAAAPLGTARFNPPGPAALPGRAQQVAVGRNSAYALLEDGQVLAWGANDSWQLGNSPTGAQPPRGVVERPRTAPAPVPGLRNITQIVAGSDFALALASDGRVYAWGGTRVGTQQPVGTPMVIPELSDIVQVAASPRHAVALGRDGRVWTWGGRNEWGELGREATGDAAWTPTVVPGLTDVVSISAGGSYDFVSGAVKRDGSVWVWGGNQSSMMGNGLNVTLGEPGSINRSPMRVPGVSNAQSITIGGGHVAVLLADRTLRLWGHDGWGQIGVGTAGGYQPSPKAPKLTDVAAVYLGGNRSLAVRRDGSLWIWGPSYSSRATGLLAANQRVPVALALP